MFPFTRKARPPNILFSVSPGWPRSNWRRRSASSSSYGTLRILEPPWFAGGLMHGCGSTRTRSAARPGASIWLQLSWGSGRPTAPSSDDSSGGVTDPSIWVLIYDTV